MPALALTDHGTMYGTIDFYRACKREGVKPILGVETYLAARQMHESGRRSGPLHLLVHPPAAFLRNYILRRGFLDGTAGLLISLVNSYGVFLKFAKLWELERDPGPGI